MKLTRKDAEKKEQDRLEKIVKKTVTTLTKNLPKDSGLNPNWRCTQLLTELTDIAFCSALDSGVTFLIINGSNLGFKSGKEIINVNPSGLEEQASILYKWADLGRSLLNEDGKAPDHYTLHGSLVLRAASHKRELQKEKSSKQHLADLVRAVALKDVRIKATDNRATALELLVGTIVKASNDLGLQFKKDMGKALYLYCSDARFGMKKLALKDMEPYFQSIIDSSCAAGKLKASGDVKNLIRSFTLKMPK